MQVSLIRESARERAFDRYAGDLASDIPPITAWAYHRLYHLFAGRSHPTSPTSFYS